MLTTDSVHTLQSALPDLQAIYLFGSQVSAHATAHSDVDLAVLLPHPLPFSLSLSLTAKLMQQLDKDVDLLDLRQLPTVIQNQVITTGKRLWTTTPALHINLFEVRVLRDMLALNERRADLIDDIIRSGKVYG